WYCPCSLGILESEIRLRRRENKMGPGSEERVVAMSSTPLPNSTFHRFQDKHGNWISGCLLCLKIVGASRSLEELKTIEDSHECSEARRVKASELFRAF